MKEESVYACGHELLSKWVEVEAFANIKDFDLVAFLWKNILCRFGVLRVIVTDNGFQFISTRFKEFCSAWKINILYSTLRHP